MQDFHGQDFFEKRNFNQTNDAQLDPFQQEEVLHCPDTQPVREEIPGIESGSDNFFELRNTKNATCKLRLK